MKKILSLLFVFSTTFIIAQNWQLINSDYTYDYEKDGEYNISVFVDSFEIIGSDTLFFLNRIVKDCNTCDNSNGHHLQYNLPTFLQREVLVTDSNYIFSNGNTFFINSNANLGDLWLFDTLNNINAEIYSIDYISVLGNMDSVKTILLSTNDSIVISKIMASLISKMNLF